VAGKLEGRAVWFQVSGPSHRVTQLLVHAVFPHPSSLKLPKAPRHKPAQCGDESLHREISYRSASVPPQYRRDFFLVFLIGARSRMQRRQATIRHAARFPSYGMRQKLRPLAPVPDRFAVDHFAFRAATTGRESPSRGTETSRIGRIGRRRCQCDGRFEARKQTARNGTSPSAFRSPPVPPIGRTNRLVCQMMHPQGRIEHARFDGGVSIRPPNGRFERGDAGGEFRQARLLQCVTRPSSRSPEGVHVRSDRSGDVRNSSRRTARARSSEDGNHWHTSLFVRPDWRNLAAERKPKRVPFRAVACEPKRSRTGT